MTEPNTLDALAADTADPAGTPFTFPVGEQTATMRRRLFGDLIDISHVEGDLFQIIKMVELVGDAAALAWFRAATEEAAIEKYLDYQRHYGYLGK